MAKDDDRAVARRQVPPRQRHTVRRSHRHRRRVGGQRSWLVSIVARLTITIVGVTLVIAGVLLGASDTGPMITDEVPAFSFVGSVLTLGGLLLLLRSLSRSFTSCGAP